MAQAENTGDKGAAPGQGAIREENRDAAQSEGEAGTEAEGAECGGGGEAEGRGDEHGGEEELPAESKGANESTGGGGGVPAEDGVEGKTEGQDASAENQGEANNDEKGADGEGENDGDDSEEEEEDEDEEEEDDDDEGNEEPLSLDWPETRQKQALYLFLLPIVFPLWLTVPDVRRQVSVQCLLGGCGVSGNPGLVLRREVRGNPAWQGPSIERSEGALSLGGTAPHMGDLRPHVHLSYSFHAHSVNCPSPPVPRLPSQFV